MRGHVAVLSVSLVIAGSVVAACLGAPSGGDQAAHAGPATRSRVADQYADERRLCVERTNEFRAKVGLPPLTVSSRLEAYAADSARHDGRTHVPHDYFNRTDGGKIALAENLVPWWSLARRKTVKAIVADGLDFMWAEGPTGGHARNIAGPYTQIGCGIFVNGDEVTLVQAFR